MPTQCKPFSFVFQGCQGRRVTAAFDGGAITSNAGVLLLREIDRSIGLLDQVADCFTDYRDPRLTEHSVGTLVRQRVMGITLGYEDLNDHDQLRHDPVLALLSGKLEGHRKEPLPGPLAYRARLVRPRGRRNDGASCPALRRRSCQRHRPLHALPRLPEQEGRAGRCRGPLD